MCGRYSLAPEESGDILRIVREIEGRFGAGVIINARGETTPDKPMFRASLLERRCVAPSTGFYEWDKSKRKYLLPGSTTQEWRRRN